MKLELCQFGAILLALTAAVTGAAARDGGGWTAEVFVAPSAAGFVGGVDAPVSLIPDGWDARIDYDVATDTIDAARAFAQGDEALLARPVFATLHRRFEGEGMTPYLGFGAGYAAGLVEDPGAIRGDSLAFKGVLGTDIELERNLDLFLEYGYALAPDAGLGGDSSLDSHTLNTGLRLTLD